MSAPLPALFVSHGSPLHALDAGAAGEAWKSAAARLPRPRAILMSSAHWETGVPVVQLSVQLGLGPRHHFELGRALAPLAGQGVLLFGSGHMTHNLRDRSDAPPAGYVLQFQEWVDARIRNGEIDRLLDFRAQAPHAARAHPTDEHFLPLFFALGAAQAGAKPERLHAAVESSALAMDAYLFANG